MATSVSLTRSAPFFSAAITRSAVSASGQRRTAIVANSTRRTQPDQPLTSRSTFAGTSLLAYCSSRATISSGFRPLATALTTDSRVSLRTIAPCPLPRVDRSQNGASAAAGAGLVPMTTTLKSGWTTTFDSPPATPARSAAATFRPK